MKINRKKAVAVAVAAVMSCGLFAGCDLVTRNEKKNLAQTVAEVNIAKSDNFKAEFENLNGDLVEKVIKTATISKMDLIASFLTSGYSSAMSYYNLSYKDVFDSLSESLAQRQVSVQYAKAFFLKNGWEGENGETVHYSEADFNEAVKDKEGKELTGVEYDIAVTKYFLTEEECKKADYTTRVMFNNYIDSYEDNYIKKEEDENDYDSDVRTTPTGLNTSNSDYYDPDYRVYTGTGEQNAVRGSYEAKEGSTTTTRLRAYSDFLAYYLKGNSLVKKGENTSDIESLEYFKLENKADLEDALTQKLTDVFTKQAEKKLSEDNLILDFNATLKNQSELYGKSSSTLESAMDSVSDTNFVLTATGNSKADSAFGFVINILLPFSAAQSDELNSVKQDFGDTKGNNFATRARLLEKIKATDQRGSWFRGETDYSFEAKSKEEAYGFEAGRKWLFFKDNLIGGNSKYERLKNYYGQYTYNGTWDEENRKYKPKQIDIDEFLFDEMEGYLKSVLGETAITTTKPKLTAPDNYYDLDPLNYYDGDDVDYEKFVYYQGKVNFNGGFNANNIFNAKSDENKAMSVINELSFAYNTDTGGLNSYLGYAVTANKTSFVSEFEYAAQKVVLAGAGNYIVVPSDYGWHIIYCTFSFVDYENGAEGDIRSPFKFVYDDIKNEGTFSNLYYEAKKADTDSTESANRSSKIILTYKKSYTIYQDRYSDLANLGNN